MPADAHELSSAVEYLSEHSAGLGIYPSFDNAENGWGIYADPDSDPNSDGSKAISINLPTFAEVIIATARAIGWSPPPRPPIAEAVTRLRGLLANATPRRVTVRTSRGSSRSALTATRAGG